MAKLITILQKADWSVGVLPHYLMNLTILDYEVYNKVLIKQDQVWCIADAYYQLNLDKF